jgi:hypothetical protein
MAEITKIEVKILEDLYKRDIENDSMLRIQPSEYELNESDSIMQIRELVSHIDKLVQLGFVDVKTPYYESSDSVSIEYLNNAVEIHDRRIKISILGIEYMDQMRATPLNKIVSSFKSSMNNTFSNHPLRVVLTHLLAFLLGSVGMYIFLRLL